MHSDWQEWMSSVQVRNRSRAFFKPRRRRNGKKKSRYGTVTDEKAHGRWGFVRQQCMCTGFVSKSRCKLFYLNMFSIFYGRNLEDAEKVPASSDAEGMSKPAVSRPCLITVGSAEWYAALEKRLSVIKKFIIPKQRPLDGRVHDVEDVMPSMTAEMQHEVEAALVSTPPDEVLASAFRLNIRRADMQTLADNQWLNDEVINFYMNLLVQRSEQQGSPRVYAFNTFFFPMLEKKGYAALKRWTRTVDLFSYDILLVPLHFDNHWCLAAVDFRKQSIAYYDSLYSEREQTRCLATLQQYLEDESQHKRNHGINWDSWTLRAMDVPQQQNFNDCGMFTCQYAECVSRDALISFGQQHMPYFRKRVVYEILHKAILPTSVSQRQITHTSTANGPASAYGKSWQGVMACLRPQFNQLSGS